MRSGHSLKILITGGHVSPAVAVIEEIAKRKKDWELLFIGRKFALEGDRDVSQEFRLITGRGIKFLGLTAGRIPRGASRAGFVSFLKLPLGFIQALGYVVRYRPSLIVSFGGYVAAPVVVAGWIAGVPSVTHEQTTALGLANRMIGLLSRRILVSYPHLVSQFSKDKVKYTGLPIREGLFHPPPKPSFPFDSQVPLLYITGGITGALSLNELIFPIVARLTKQYMVVHQTGRISFSRSQEIRSELPRLQQARYWAAPYLDISDVAWTYRYATLVIGRSGANTVGEIAALGMIALFIPLPWSAGSEQQLNARLLQKNGSAIVLDQDRLPPAQLGDTINQMMSDRHRYEKSAHSFARNFFPDAARRVVDELTRIVEE